MGTGYTRNDTSNNIADGNVVNASDLDGEFDAVESAFSTSGHTHDGTAAEGGPVTVVGPAQDVVVSGTNVNPKTTNTLDLGTASLKYKDAYLQGNITVDGTVDGRDVATDGAKLDGIEPSATADQTDAEIRAAVEAATDSNVFTDADHTKLNGIEASADVTDTTNVTAAGALMDSEVTNLAQVKAFDSADYATAAQGATADAALPKSGGTMTGTIASFESTGIDDNATSTALTLDSSQNASFAGDVTIDGETLLVNSPSTATDVAAIHFNGSTTTSARYANISKMYDSPYTMKMQASNSAGEAPLELWGSSDTMYLGFETSGNATFSGNIAVGGTVDGRDVATDGTKLDGIESSATADQTDAEIRAAVEAATDSNVFTDADHTKLNGIETGADVTDTTNVTAAGALMDSELTDLAGVKGVTISTLQEKPSEGAFANGDKTKLDGIEAGADVTDATNVASAGAAMLTGATFTGDINVGTLQITTAGNIALDDNDVIYFGTGNDVEFFTNGTHMYTDLNAGIGNWYIRDGSTTRFTFDDDGSFTATANITAYSDRKLKDNLEVIPNALGKVSQLTGYTYDRIDMDGIRQSGLIAQDVQEVLPEVIVNNVDPDSGEETLSVAYGNMIGLLVEAIKELKVEVEELKGK